MLEEELGVSLFNRTARGMQLTEEGEYLRVSAAGPLRALELALQNVRSFSSRIEGNVTIGMPSNIGDALAKPLVLRMYTHFPNIKLRIAEAMNGSLIDWLNRGVVDFALLEEASRDGRLTDRELLSERLMLVGASTSHLDPDHPIGFKEAVQLPLILPAHDVGIRAVLDNAAAKSSTMLNIRSEADSSKLTKELVEDGIGYAFLPFSYFRSEYIEGKLKYCPIVNPTLTLTTYLSSRKHNRATGDRIEAAVVENIISLVHSLTTDNHRGCGHDASPFGLTEL